MSTPWKYLVACLGTLVLIGCFASNHQSLKAPNRPGYRILPFMNVRVIFGPELSKIKTAETRLQQYLKRINLSLARDHGFKLRAVRSSTALERALTIVVAAKPEWLESSPQVYPSAIPIQITVEALTKGTNEEVLVNLETQIYESFGIPKACLSRQLSSSDLRLTKLVVNLHIQRSNEQVLLSGEKTASQARDTLAAVSAVTLPQSCFSSPSGINLQRFWLELSQQEQGVPAKSTSNRYSLGVNALKNGKPKLALRLCKSAAEESPQGGAARCAALASQTLNEHLEAARYWRAHLSFFPNDRGAYLGLARNVGRAGDDDAARAILSQAVRRFPDWIDGRIELGIALYRLGQEKEARALWHSILEKDPTHPEVKQLIEDYTEAE